jgi:hypothetical protein
MRTSSSLSKVIFKDEGGAIKTYSMDACLEGFLKF